MIDTSSATDGGAARCPSLQNLAVAEEKPSNSSIRAK